MDDKQKNRSDLNSEAYPEKGIGRTWPDIFRYYSKPLFDRYLHISGLVAFAVFFGFLAVRLEGARYRDISFDIATVSAFLALGCLFYQKIRLMRLTAVDQKVSSIFAAEGTIKQIEPTAWASTIQPAGDDIEKDGDLEDPKNQDAHLTTRGMYEFFQKLRQLKGPGTIILRARDRMCGGAVSESIKADFRYKDNKGVWVFRLMVNEDTPAEMREVVFKRLRKKVEFFVGSEVKTVGTEKS